MSVFAQYLESLRRELGGDIATESTYRPALKVLLESGGEGISATNEPKRTQCGAPDFSISRKKVLIGYVETKDIGTNLDEMEQGKGPHGKQFIRYRDGLPNWVLNDYLEFRWFVNGKKRLTARLAGLDAKGKINQTQDGEQKLDQLLSSFFKEPALTVTTAKDLAMSLAHMTRIVRELIIEAIKEETEEVERHRVKEETSSFSVAPSARGPWLQEWLAAFRQVLIPDLNEAQFADMFAQTLAYGLFAARVHAPAAKQFSREMAAFNLPKTNPFLRKLFQEIAGDMPDSIAWAVDDIVELLKHADMPEILKDFGKGKGKEDPIVHFYETFLAAYDRKMRELRGVYYTPEPVVSYIVRSIDYLLKTRFNRPKGLADENTLILDPATGTATFLYFVIDHIYQSFAGQKGSWDDYVSNHLLNRIFGFELLMAPYAVAHLKLGMQLEQTGYKFGSDQRLGIYLTNTLEEAAKKSEQLFASWVADEANAAAKIKKELPIMIILGNPPYSSSICEGDWILSLIADYKKGLQEKKTDLNREEWKFLRFAQWRIQQTGYGIIGFIINNSFLDAITHRRMRECLLKTFDEIFILDLHGSIMGKKKSPTIDVDQNIFDIEQGVTIAIFIKNDNKKKTAIIRHKDLWGLRENKNDFLVKNDISTMRWTILQPCEEEYFFIPYDASLRSEYELGWKLPQVFSEYSSGIQTKKDRLTIQFDASKMLDVVRELINQPSQTARERFDLGEDTDGWSLENAILDLKKTGISHEKVAPILYRPFDIRFTYYTGKTSGFHGRPRKEIMHHILAGPNLALITMRQIVGSDHNHFGVTRIINCHGTFYLGNRGQDYLFPLYLYPETKDNIELHKDRNPNFSFAFMKKLAEKMRQPQEDPFGLPKGISPEDIFHYAYAVFHSPTYRSRYAEFLKIDFPRLPLTSSLKLFRALTSKGAELVALHLMESPKLADFITEFPQKGDNIVEKVQYTDKDKRVWINKTQYFSGVPKAVWEFHVGGYQVCEKWLKDRKGRKLSYDDIQHYQKIVVALKETIRLMAEIDKLIASWPIT